MAQSKDIELILQARLEEGTSLTSAQNMGKSIADSIEKAFEGIGEKIAEKLFRELSQTLQRSDVSSAVGASITRKESSVGVSLPTHQEAVLEAKISRHLQQQEESAKKLQLAADRKFRDVTEIQRDFSVLSSSSKSKMSDNDLYGTLGRLSTDEALKKRFSDLSTPDASSEFKSNKMFALRSEVIKADSTIDVYERYKKAKELNPGVSLGDFDLTKNQVADSAKQMASLASEGFSESIGLTREIEKLRLELASNTKATEEERRTMETQLRSKIERRSEVDNDNLIIEGKRAALKDALSEQGPSEFFQKHQRTFAGVTGIAGAVGVGASMFSQLDYRQALAKVGAQDLRSFSGRDIANLDYTNMSATQMLGGEESLREKSKWNARFEVGGSMLTGAASLAGGAFMTKASGGLLALPGIELGRRGLQDLSQGYSSYLNFDKTQELHMRKLQAAEAERYKDVFNLADRGRSVRRNAYHDAQAMGAEELDNFFVGGTERDGLAGYAQTTANVSEGAFRQGLRSFAEVVRPVRGGRNILETGGAEGDAFDSNYKQALLLQGKGYSNAVQNAGLFSRGAGLEESMNPMGAMNKGMMLHNHLYAELLKSGLDKQTASDLMNNASSMAGSGIGMRSIAIDYARDIAKGSQAYGNNPTAVEAVTKGQLMKLGDISGQGDDLGRQSKLLAIAKFERESGKELSDTDRHLMLKSGVTDETMRTVFGAKEDGSYYSSADFKNQTLSEVNKVDPTGFIRAGDIEAGTFEEAQVILKNRMSDFVGKDEALGGTGPKISATLGEGGHDSKNKNFVKFENATNIEKVVESFSAMDRVMPNLNFQFAQFCDWLEQVREQMNEMNLPAKGKSSPNQIQEGSGNPYMNMMEQWKGMTNPAKPPKVG
jgi:hypothetical protein